MNTEDIRDIKGLFGLYGWYRPGLWLAVFIVLALGALWFYKRRKKPPSAPAPVPVRPPHVIALEALERLRARAQESNPKPFHFGLSEVLRTYLEARFTLPATDRTTEEIQRLLTSAGSLTDSQKASLLTVLKTTDLVKFTDTILSTEQSLEAWEQTRHFVTATREVTP